jgi:hypothetical protein
MLDLKIASCNLLGPANAIIFLGIWILLHLNKRHDSISLRQSFKSKETHKNVFDPTLRLEANVKLLGLRLIHAQVRSCNKPVGLLNKQ